MKDDGVLFICDLVNLAENGEMPNEGLLRKKRYWFQIKTIGINRQYLAKGVNERVDLLVDIQFDLDVRIGQYVVLGNGEQFRIDTVSHFDEPTELRRTELGLYRLENYYAVSN